MIAAEVFSHFNLDFNIMVLFTYFSNDCRDDKLLELSISGCLQEMRPVYKIKIFGLAVIFKADPPKSP